jgi:purine-nucleoside/S-methyl-5'-thioadenosine phosphorylase / adenosine deaminase
MADDVLRWACFAGLPLDAGVTTRAGGVSGGPYASLNLGLHVGDDPAAVLENRTRAAKRVGLTRDDLVFARQVHGRAVALVGPGDRGRGAGSDDDALDGVDALVTATPGLGLAVLAADCVPLVLYDPVAHVLGCVHAGWRGTVARVAAAAVEAMATLGARPGDLLAAIGPAIEPDRYQVGPEVADAATDSFGPRAGELLRPDGTGRWLFDLGAANRQALLDCGLAPERVAAAGVGTGDDRFFSDRAVRPCGRHAAIAVLLARD